MRVGWLSLACALVLASSPLTARTLQQDHWGGVDIEIDFKTSFTTIEFDCARGMVSERFLIDRQGQFDVSGTYVPEGPGPIAVTDPPLIHPARYTGDVHNGVMHLTVTLLDTGETT